MVEYLPPYSFYDQISEYVCTYFNLNHPGDPDHSVTFDGCDGLMRERHDSKALIEAHPLDYAGMPKPKSFESHSVEQKAKIH